ncbi:4a-hydroxytetrahydrobiopterin dehydratase [Catenovulum agarivorans]|uniref:4a-hydroxytetrahydrobiopterin dehydratase n=1 Tax=Catenovulum agarivorans TaxID=1172192 RepID=UPI0002DC45C5|nr:4a-hydroxytetrahydrobiopterin dehydratase [Catenovulum agarivorans]
MANLTEQSCEACRVGAPLATTEEIAQWLPQLTDWQIVNVDSIDRLTRTYQFNNFVNALAFTNKVGELAESMGHHPALLTEWGRVTVSWWTHKIKGLHKNDFICAAKTDAIYPSLSK